MSFGFGFALPAYPLRGGGGNNPFNQLGPTLDLSFVDGATNVGDLSNPNGYTLNTNFIIPQYQVAAQYVVWETGVGLVDKTFSQIVTFSRTSGATWFNSAGVNVGIDFSTSSVAIGTGSKTFTLTATAGVDRSWATGDIVRISEQATPANFMDGTVTSYTASTQVLVIDVTSTGGSGTIASWRVSSHMPRFDYNPDTLAAQGLLIEEARTNSIRNNTMQGAVAGTPGTLPTNWSLVGLGTLTQTVVGTGTENGVTYIDVRFNGTTSTTQLPIRFEPSTQIAAANGQSWSISQFVRTAGGSLSNITGVGLTMSIFDSGGSYLADIGGGDITITSTLTRQSRSGTIVSASAAFIRPIFYVNFASGVAIDITLRIGLPQLENNNISTGVASATVASGGSGYAVGDVLQIVGGTASTAARLTVATLSGSAVATVTVSTAGSYSVFPSPQPVSVTAITGTGTSATFNIVPQTQTGFATSVIPTTVAQVTRNADQASVNTLSPWYNQTAGTIFFVGQRQTNASDFNRAVSFNDGVGNNVLSIYCVTNKYDGYKKVSAGPDNFYGGPTVGTLLNVRRTALASDASGMIMATDGTLGGASTAAGMPTVTALTIGSDWYPARYNGWIQRITYYPRKLSSAELQAITA